MCSRTAKDIQESVRRLVDLGGLAVCRAFEVEKGERMGRHPQLTWLHLQLAKVAARVRQRKPLRSYLKHLSLHLHKTAKVLLMILAKPLSWLVLSLANVIISLASFQIPVSKRDQTGSEMELLFVPYSYPPTRTLHLILASTARRLGHRAVIASTDALTDGVAAREAPFKIVEDIIFDNVDEAIEFLHSMGGDDEILATAIIDQFIRYCPVSFFVSHPVVSGEFQTLVKKAVEKASVWSELYPVAVVGDSSYLANGAVISAFLKKGRKVFAADFVGTFREITQRQSERRNRDLFYSQLEKLRRGENKLTDFDRQIESFFSDRYSGNSPDPEIAQAFGKVGIQRVEDGHARKVLFLHSFRDANGQVASPELGSSLFRTYFQWADAALAIVSESPKQWIVKSHPSFARLEGDIEILKYLLDKHNIPPSIVDPGVTAGYVLSNRWPIFTHDGTIAREAATFGYKAVSISVHLPEEITWRLTSLEDFYYWYRLDPEHVNGEPLDALTVRAAKRMFYDHVSPGLTSVAMNVRPEPGISYFARQLFPAQVSFNLAKKYASSAGRNEVFRAVSRLIQG